MKDFRVINISIANHWKTSRQPIFRLKHIEKRQENKCCNWKWLKYLRKPRFRSKIIENLIVCEKCLMRSNILKPMNFNDFMVRAVQKSIRKKTNKSWKNGLGKMMRNTSKNHQKSDPKWSQKPLKNHSKIDRKFDTKKGAVHAYRICTRRGPGGSIIQQDSSGGNLHK